MTRSSGHGGAPQGFEYASTARRSVAYTIDVMVLVAIWWLALRVIDPPRVGASIDLSQALIAVFGLAYFVGSWTRFGATPGQKLLDLRVLDIERGVPLTVRRRCDVGSISS